MPRAAACVFANNYHLHMSTLTIAVVVHVLVMLTVPEAFIPHLLAFIATLPLLAGRVALHRHFKPIDAQRWASTGWCLTIIAVYVSTGLDVEEAVRPAVRASKDPVFGGSIIALCMMVGTLHASVAPPLAHSLAVLAVLTAAMGWVVVQTHSLAMVGWSVGLLLSHVLGYALSTHCFEQQATIVRFKEDKAEMETSKAEIETRNAQLVSEKERLAWEVASHHGHCCDCPDPLATLGASIPLNQPSAQHLVLGVLQPQEVTDAAVSMACSADHSPTEMTNSTPPPGPLFTRAVPTPPLPNVVRAPRSNASSSIASSLVRNNPSLCASSVMESPSKVAERGPPYAPCMPLAPPNLVHRHVAAERSMSTPLVRRALAM